MNSAQADSPSCHEKNMDGEDANALMPMTDCMDVELQVANDGVSVKKPDQQANTIIYAWADETLSYSFQPADQNAIRGPPDWGEARNAAPFLILTTQRFRI